MKTNEIPQANQLDNVHIISLLDRLEAAKKILDSVVVEDDFLKQIVSSIRERLEINNCEVFKIQSS